MQTEFKMKLASVRASAEQIYRSTDSIPAICKEAIQELDCYANMIPDFFSYKHEAVRIKDLYAKLKTLDYSRNKVINCINVDCAGYLYKEYLGGMYTFIGNFFSEVGSNGSNIKMMENQLQMATQGDPIFIESLFGGKNNEPVELELTDAIKNIEYLVDFLDTLTGIKQMVCDVCNRANELSNYEHSLTAVRLMVHSVCTFSNRTISAIMDIYNAIQDKLNDAPVVRVQKKTLTVF